MPQMCNMDWLMLMIYFLLIFYLFLMKIYFFMYVTFNTNDLKTYVFYKISFNLKWY